MAQPLASHVVFPIGIDLDCNVHQCVETPFNTSHDNSFRSLRPLLGELLTQLYKDTMQPYLLMVKRGRGKLTPWKASIEKEIWRIGKTFLTLRNSGISAISLRQQRELFGTF